jgi:hypothetical protein
MPAKCGRKRLLGRETRLNPQVEVDGLWFGPL